jgi:hypothetical protein
VSAHDQVDLLAQVGVAVLLFAVGLKLDLHHIRHIGPVALATGLGQLAFTIVIGFVLLLALGKGLMDAICVAVALTFSNTIIIVKLLSDKRELDRLHGRIAVGFLIVQDLAVVLYSQPLYERLAPSAWVSSSGRVPGASWPPRRARTTALRSRRWCSAWAATAAACCNSCARPA